MDARAGSSPAPKTPTEMQGRHEGQCREPADCQHSCRIIHPPRGDVASRRSYLKRSAPATRGRKRTGNESLVAWWQAAKLTPSLCLIFEQKSAIYSGIQIPGARRVETSFSSNGSGDAERIAARKIAWKIRECELARRWSRSSNPARFGAGGRGGEGGKKGVSPPGGTGFGWLFQFSPPAPSLN